MLGLVVAVGVEGEVAEHFSGGGVDDADVEVFDEEDDGGLSVGSADSHVVEFAGGAEGDDSVVTDDVLSGPVVAVCQVGGGGFGEPLRLLGWFVGGNGGVDGCCMCRRRRRGGLVGRGGCWPGVGCVAIV